MTCTLKEHYSKAHGMQLTTSELNKICVKLPPGPINLPLTIPHQTIETQDEIQIIEQQEQHQQDTANISLISISGIGENETMMTAISSPVNLAK